MTSLSVAQTAPARRGTARSAVAGIGVYLPPAWVADAPLPQGSAVTGVAERVQAQSGISTPSLAAGAARAALRAAAVAGSEIEMVVVGTTSPDVLWPSTACLVQTELALPRVACFDLYAAEAGLLTALAVADRYVATGTRAVLVIGAESVHQLVQVPSQPGPRSGRAASAVVLRGSDGPAGILASVVGGAATTERGADVHDRVLLRGLAEAVDQCLEQARLSLEEVDLVIGEQTAPEVMRAYARATRIPAARLLLDPQRYWSAFATAPFVALHDAVGEGRLRAGMTALLVSCGRGPAWAVACLRWGVGGVSEW